MKRKTKIEQEIKELETRLEFLRAQLKSAEVSDAEDAEKFQRLPARVRSHFDDWDEFTRFVYGQMENAKRIRGVNFFRYTEAETPRNRILCIRGVGLQTADETMEQLSDFM